MKSLCSVLAAAAFLPATPAPASVIYFSLTGHDTASFSIDTSTKAAVGDGNTDSIYYAVPGIYEGVAGTADISFFNADANGGFEIEPLPEVHNNYLSPVGAAVISAAVDYPTFLLGTYHYTKDLRFGAVDDQFIVSDSPITASAVPEPASWAMMIFGLIGVGFAVRRKHPSSLGSTVTARQRS